MGRTTKRGHVKSLHDDGAYAVLVAMIVQKRRAAGLSQQALAERLGWQQSIVAKIETVQRRMDVVEFLQIASALGFDPVRMVRDFRNELIERGVIEP